MEQNRRFEEETRVNLKSPDSSGGSETEGTTTEPPKRGQWSNQWEFIISVLGLCIGLGNIWRFPYLCYKNGGGAFLVPYLFCLIVCGIPMLFLELSLGQYMSKGGLHCWNIVPIFKGIGYSLIIVNCYSNIYYIIILAWALHYLIFSFSSVLPWSHCNNTWNTPSCSVARHISLSPNLSLPGNSSINYTLTDVNMANNTSVNAIWSDVMNKVDPVTEFWERRVLEISPGFEHPDGVVWQLALCLLAIWIVCYFCIWRGVRWTGKVVYVTVGFPYFMLLALLVRAVTLPGAREGILYYVRPDFNRLADVQVWVDAGTQIFFSFAIGFGSIPSLGSYNKFNNDCYRQGVIISLVNSGTSLLAGFLVFSLLGFMALEQNVPIDTVAESGPGLAFIVYPKIVTLMPVSPVWAVLFFLMVVMVGLDSQFVNVEGAATMVMDSFPWLLRKWGREIFLAIYCILSYFIGLSMVTRGGMYVFQLFDHYAVSGMSLLWVCFFECITIGWVLGACKYYDVIEMMIGYRINPWMGICWTVLTPGVLLGLFVSKIIQFRPLTYNRTYTYPTAAQGFGMFLAFSSMICIPAYFFLSLIFTQGSIKQRLRKLTITNTSNDRIPKHWPEFNRSRGQENHENQPLAAMTGV